MTHQFAQLTFTPEVRRWQSEAGSRASYASFDEGPIFNNALTEREMQFIAARDSLFMATVGESGWPYVQHRGGPIGFVKALDEQTLGFADYAGNRQYISAGNLSRDDRVSLFFMDWPNQRRLKLLGRVRFIGLDAPEQLGQLADPDYPAQIERGVLIHVEAYDWNCPAHITPRFTLDEIRARAPVAEASSPAPVSASARSIEWGHGPLPLVVTATRQLTSRIRAYELSSADGAALPTVEPGAHLRVPVQTVETADGELTERHYSITSTGPNNEHYEIAVLLEEHGLGGSRAIHDQISLGDRLNVDPPLNHFALHEDDRPAVLIAGGIGITPIRSMADALAQRGTPFALHYAGRNPNDMAYRVELERKLGPGLHTYAKTRGERLDIEGLIRNTPDAAIFYVCGPSRLTASVLSAAREQGIDPERIRSELFA